MEKICIVCKKTFLLDEFPKRSASKDGHTSKCFECTRTYNRKDYADNRPNRFAKNNAFKKTRQQINRAYVIEYLLTHPCVDCGETDIVVLDFDHVRGVKLGNVSKMVLGAYQLEVIITEIAKCEVRCANDHRRVTATRRQQNK